jgi:hypothetical protein
MNNRFEFKGTARRSILYLIASNGLVAIALLVSRAKLHFNTALIMFGIVNISYLASIVNKPFKLIIHQDKLLLEIHYLLSLLKKSKVVPLHDIECSFNYEVRARGGKAKVLKIKYENRTVVELLPDYNGWAEKSLTQIFEKLNDLKKFNYSPTNKSKSS